MRPGGNVAKARKTAKTEGSVGRDCSGSLFHPLRGLSHETKIRIGRHIDLGLDQTQFLLRPDIGRERGEIGERIEV